MKKNKQTLFILFSLLCLCFSSCTIDEEINFNKDFSGNFSYSLNFASMKEMMKSMQSSFGDSTQNNNGDMDKAMEEFSKNPDKMSAFNNIDGISNFKAAVDEAGLVKFSFDFKDVAALNKGYNALVNSKELNMGMGGSFNKDFMTGGFNPGTPPDEETKTEVKPKEDFEYFKQKGNTIIYKRPKNDNKSNDSNELKQQLEMAKGMGELITYNTKITFDKKIKSVNAKNIETKKDGNSISLTLKTSDMMSDKPSPEITIKVK